MVPGRLVTAGGAMVNSSYGDRQWAASARPANSNGHNGKVQMAVTIVTDCWTICGCNSHGSNVQMAVAMAINRGTGGDCPGGCNGHNGNVQNITT